jgi:hypothetical protein
LSRLAAGHCVSGSDLDDDEPDVHSRPRDSNCSARSASNGRRMELIVERIAA